MKATDFLVIVVIIGLVTGIVTLAIGEFNNLPYGNNINVTGLEQYDKVEEINEDVNDTLESFRTLGDDEAGWFSKISAGIVAIPKVVIGFPVLIISSMTLFASMISTSLNGIIPPFVIFAIITLLLIIIARRLFEFFNKTRA